MEPASASPCLDSDIPGAVNLRDLGGLPAGGGASVRRGLLYRSGITHHIEPDGLALMSSRLGIRTVFDLRNDGELERDGVAPFHLHGITHRRLALRGITAMTAEARREYFKKMARRDYDWCIHYQELVSRYPDSFVGFLRTLLEPGVLPALFHCAGGRDRTGVAAALVLATLGVSDEVIAGDYARTGALLQPHLHRYNPVRVAMGLSEQQMSDLLHTDADSMLRFLAWLGREEGIQALPARQGLTHEETAQLRAVLLEEG